MVKVKKVSNQTFETLLEEVGDRFSIRRYEDSKRHNILIKCLISLVERGSPLGLRIEAFPCLLTCRYRSGIGGRILRLYPDLSFDLIYPGTFIPYLETIPLNCTAKLFSTGEDALIWLYKQHEKERI